MRKIKINKWITFAMWLTICIAIASVAHAQRSIGTPDQFKCLPPPWNRAQVMDCQASYAKDGAVHLFCHFKLARDQQ